MSCIIHLNSFLLTVSRETITSFYLSWLFFSEKFSSKNNRVLSSMLSQTLIFWRFQKGIQTRGNNLICFTLIYLIIRTLDRPSSSLSALNAHIRFWLCCLFANMYLCMSVCMSICMYVCMHVCMYIFMYVWMYAFMWVCQTHFRTSMKYIT